MAVNDLLLVNSSFNKDNDSNHQEDEAMIPKCRHSSLPLPIVSVPSTGGSRDFGSVSFFQRKKSDVSSTGKSGRRHFFFFVSDSCR